MRRREEIEKASICQYQIIGTIGEQEAFKNGFVKGAEWADKTMIERLQKLKCGYEHDLNSEPRVYEIDIQLYAKISLIERLILELKEE